MITVESLPRTRVSKICRTSLDRRQATCDTVTQLARLAEKEVTLVRREHRQRVAGLVDENVLPDRAGVVQTAFDPGFEAAQVFPLTLGSALCHCLSRRERRSGIGQQGLLGAEHAQQSLEHVAHHETGVVRRGSIDLGDGIVFEDHQLGDGRIVVTQRSGIAGRQRNTELVAVTHVAPCFPWEPILRPSPAFGICARRNTDRSRGNR
jgi:hypothetical protein